MWVAAVLAALILAAPLTIPTPSMADVGPTLPAENPAHLAPPDPEVRPWPAGVRQGPALLDLTPAAATGEKRLLVLLVEFANVAHNASRNPAYFEDLLDGLPPRKSLRAYYEEVSFGALTTSATVAPGWTSSARTMAYYGEDSATGVDDANAALYSLVIEAVQAADAAIDFGPFDGDGDGAVDHLVVVHAGAAQESRKNETDLIWSHSWVVYDADPGQAGTQPLMADGVRIYEYIMVSEESPVGIVAHEFGHDLGLLDLYDTDDDADDVDEGAGRWDLMGTGAWNGWPRGSSPAHPSAWTRSRLGWIVPSTVDAPLRTLTMGAVETARTVWKLPVRTDPGGSEYFLLENRQPIGFDAALPGDGLLVWHVDETRLTNDADAHRLLDLEESDEAFTGDRPKDPEDAWASSAEGFGPWSAPSSHSYESGPTGWRVRDISSSSDPMTVTVARDLPLDLAVAEIRAPELVAAGSSVRADVLVRNEGTSTISGQIAVRAYRGLPDAGMRVAAANASVADLLPGGTLAIPLVFATSVAGRYVVHATATAEQDALRANDERLAHLVADAIAFRDGLESGPGNWTTDGLANDTHRWDLLDDASPNGSSWSHSRAWRFGAFWDASPNPSTARWHVLTSRPIAVPAGPLHLVFRNRYDLWGRPATETPSSDSETDHAVVEVHLGSGNWTPVREFRGRDLRWTPVDIELAANVPAPTTLEIRFNASQGVMPEAGGWWIDDIVVRSRGLERAVFLLPSVTELEGAAGTGTGMDLRIANLGETVETFAFSAETPPEWRVTIARGESSPLVDAGSYIIALAPDESAVLRAIVWIPGSAAGGANGSVLLSASAAGDGATSDTVVLEVRVTAPSTRPAGLTWLMVLLVAGVVAALLGLVLRLGKRPGPRT